METLNIATSGEQPEASAPKGGTGPSPLLEPYLDQQVKGKKTTPGSDSAPKESSANATSNQWTVVADLGILFDNVGHQGQHMGAEDKLNGLQAIADKTKGSPVTIVAGVLVNDGTDVPGKPLSASKKPYQFEIVEIHDGKVAKVVQPHDSKGVQQDLADLLDYSLKHDPADKTALAINVHGLGNQGIEGGMIGRANGLIQVDKLSSTIDAELKANNHGKLDLIDMDSCLMAQVGVLEHMEPVTKNIVLSEKTETVSTNPQDIDGQNMTKWTLDLLNNPSMSGTDLGKKIVDEANHNANGANRGPDGREDIQGTATLANFDLSKLQEFNAKLNNLGVLLTKALSNPDSRATIENLTRTQSNITNSSPLTPDQGEYAAKIDLLGYVNQLEMWTHNGSIADPDHKLENALTDMKNYLQNRNGMIDATHLPVFKDLSGNPLILANNNLGGLSAYVPHDASPFATPKQVKDRRDNVVLEAGASNSGWQAFLEAVQ